MTQEETSQHPSFLGIHLQLSEGEMDFVSDRLALAGEQREVASSLLGGASPEDLAASLEVALDAADRRIQELYGKLGIKTRVQLAMLVLKVLAGKPEEE